MPNDNHSKLAMSQETKTDVSDSGCGETKNAQDGAMSKIADFEKPMTKSVANKNPDDLTWQKVSERMTDAGEIQNGQCPTKSGFELTLTKSGALFVRPQEKSSKVSYWGVKALIWLFALDQSAGKSRRGLVAM